MIYDFLMALIEICLSLLLILLITIATMVIVYVKTHNEEWATVASFSVAIVLFSVYWIGYTCR